MYHTGSFIEGESFLYYLDPRLKLAAVVFLSIFILWVKAPVALMTGIVLMCVALSAGINVRTIAQAVKPLLFFIILILLAHVFFGSGGDRVEKTGYVFWTGLRQGSIVIWRFLCLIVAGVLLTMTTRPSQMLAAVKYFLRPLKSLRVPVDDIAVMMILALRLLPVLLMEKERVEIAWKARGYDLRQSGFMTKLKAFLSLTGRILLGIFRRADELALAMDARNYCPGDGRTSLAELKFAFTDYLALIFFSIFVIIFVALNSLFG